jgi:hypothetical protein
MERDTIELEAEAFGSFHRMMKVPSSNGLPGCHAWSVARDADRLCTSRSMPLLSRKMSCARSLRCFIDMVWSQVNLHVLIELSSLSGSEIQGLIGTKMFSDFDMSSAHLCDDMAQALSAEEGSVIFVPKFREYGIPINDGGTSYKVIQYCPWCGRLLPASLRNEWFDRMDAMLIDPTDEQSIPPCQRSP